MSTGRAGTSKCASPIRRGIETISSAYGTARLNPGSEEAPSEKVVPVCSQTKLARFGLGYHRDGAPPKRRLTDADLAALDPRCLSLVRWADEPEL